MSIPLPRAPQKQTRGREDSTHISRVSTLQSPHTRRDTASLLEPEGRADGLWHGGDRSLSSAGQDYPWLIQNR